MTAPLVVIVDDDQGVRTALDGLLRSIGCRVVTFDRVEPFLASPLAQDAACVITDLRMPGGLDGIDLIEELRGRVAVILISAFLDAPTRRRADGAGAWCILDKPCPAPQLVERVKAAITQKQRPSAS